MCYFLYFQSQTQSTLFLGIPDFLTGTHTAAFPPFLHTISLKIYHLFQFYVEHLAPQISMVHLHRQPSPATFKLSSASELITSRDLFPYHISV